MIANNFGFNHLLSPVRRTYFIVKFDCKIMISSNNRLKSSIGHFFSNLLTIYPSFFIKCFYRISLFKSFVVTFELFLLKANSGQTKLRPAFFMGPVPNNRSNSLNTDFAFATCFKIKSRGYNICDFFLSHFMFLSSSKY